MNKPRPRTQACQAQMGSPQRTPAEHTQSQKGNAQQVSSRGQDMGDPDPTLAHFLQEGLWGKDSGPGV